MPSSTGSRSPGRSSVSLNELYREVILDHYRAPRHHDHLADPSGTAEGKNPLCGDEVTIEIALDGDVISDIGAIGVGCSISQASASMMSEAVSGKSRAEVEELVRKFKVMMAIEDSDEEIVNPDRPGEALGDLEALQGVRKFPVRIKCADLPWITLQQALEEAE
ncbi:MAG: SUF system NifU family Fe-S cluster assembly protein [Acidimicrobiia bacterium]|nr:SUF system NifU family Fe-S cluster assembly protein [Acidimicrobiia bacterium]MBT8247317.1 SUF system NifU family Fe-S cluster assembly protein [Acidimicrobiia bacterium]NNF88829.1 SUF system NifU family Fe-S cluster assembly protein [Acidimicrobiia bacterium]NNL13935.1 SUF system NifU family Fe-S cluster assembly protein [Acidimicrobiia bacterium]NNL96895.1 SUF system NifU family Fe-S cluster assembly protein [Acidimicrobiia bacterium]